MTDAIEELKIRAGILHRRIRAHDVRALARLRALAKFRLDSEETLAVKAEAIRRQDCLSILAAELGFANWPQAKAVLAGEKEGGDFSTLLCPPGFSGHLNLWFARYEEAAAAREARQGFLLAYRRQFLVVDRYYIEDLGLDPTHPDWEAMGYDWARPKSLAARGRLYAKLIAGRPREAA